MNLFAFFGTGTCDPNKSLKELLALLAGVALWIVIVIIVRKIAQSNQKKAAKIIAGTLVLAGGVLISLALFVFTSIALACSRY